MNKWLIVGLLNLSCWAQNSGFLTFTNPSNPTVKANIILDNSTGVPYLTSDVPWVVSKTPLSPNVICSGNSVSDSTLLTLVVASNDLLFNRTFTGAAIAVQVTGSLSTGSPAYSTTAKIQNNMVNSLVAQPGGIGISVKDNNYGNPDVYVIDNNVIRQFAASITTNTYGSNAGVTTQFFLRNNAVGGGTITSTDTGLQHSNVVKSGNLNDSGIVI